MAYLLAVLAALANALTTILQRMGVEDAPDSSTMRLSLVTHALRRGVWLLGFFFMICGFLTQAFALHVGRLSVVQPILTFPVGKDQSCEGLSIIFHPNYVKNRQVFIFANLRKQKGSNGDRMEHDTIWRFRVDDKPPHAIIPTSGEKLIEWTSAGHDGGDMAFGADGDLYITAGDGTTGSDPAITGQDLTDLNASILRIDVDHPDPGKPYGIPKDNPFLNIPKARPEIWAFGVRNPWRMSFDPATGKEVK